jgi:hypothetical protein
MGSVSECCACGAEYRGFPHAGILICPPCEAEVMEAVRGMMPNPEDDDSPDPGILWYDTSAELE